MLEKESAKLEDSLTAKIRISKENEEIDKANEVDKIWKETKEKINIEEQLLYENVNKYIYLRDERYLEYIETNAKEIQQLNKLKKEYYDQIFS